jgi:hypothetical protein
VRKTTDAIAYSNDVYGGCVKCGKSPTILIDGVRLCALHRAKYERAKKTGKGAGTTTQPLKSSY